MGDAAVVLGFVAAADADPETDADAGHVGHFGGEDGQTVFQSCDVAHLKSG